VTELVCSGCHQIWTEDPSGLCEDCQTDVVSQRPGSITEDQRMAVIGLLMELGIAFSRHARAEMIARAIPGWTWQGDLNALSQQQAGDLLEYLQERRTT
jgi:hypothetical protein